MDANLYNMKNLQVSKESLRCMRQMILQSLIQRVGRSFLSDALAVVQCLVIKIQL